MKRLRAFVVSGSGFLIPYALFLTLGAWLLLGLERGAVLLWINAHSSDAAGWFFKFMTRLPEATALTLILLILIVYRFGYALFVGSNLLFAGLSAQFLKRQVFPAYDRPTKFFEGVHEFQFTDGVEVMRHFSFPSGHTAAGFAIFFSLAILTRSKALQLGFFLLALGVGISRIYLLQHFFVDVYFGSILGVLVCMLTHQLIWERYALFDNGFLRRSIFRRSRDKG